MKVDINLLEKLEKLSHLNIADEKKEQVVSQLSEILEFVDNLNELNTDNLDSYFSTIEGGTPIREDVVQSSQEVSSEILKNAPESSDDFFIVPAIIEG